MDKKNTSKRPLTPTAESLERELLCTFLICFKLTYADIKHKISL